MLNGFFLLLGDITADMGILIMIRTSY